MKPPLEPSKEDCCNSGCNPCIFDVYEKQMTIYKKNLEGGESASKVIEGNAISQLEYTPFIVIDNISLCESHNLLLLRRKKLDDKKVHWNPGQHFLFKFQGKGNVCTRAYTPIHYKTNSYNSVDFTIIIKNYENGLVSKYLYSLVKGAQTLWRGPYGSFEIIQNKFSRIVMIAQGTGIAPFLSIIEKILSNDDEMTRIILLYCCESIDKILFRDTLFDYKLYWNFMYQLYVGNVHKEMVIKYKEPVIDHKLNYQDLDNFLPFSGDEQFLLCGSEQFMKHFKLYFLEKKVQIENVVLF